MLSCSDFYDNEVIIKIDKLKLKDAMGRPLTQGLFLEIGYNLEYAVFTLKDEDHVYQDKTCPSLKKLYLEYADYTEYEFARTYLAGWLSSFPNG